MLTFTQFLNEGRGFELGGSKYSSGFGRYTKDGKSISKEEYLKASSEYKNGKTQTHPTKKSSNAETKTFSDGSSYELTPTTTKINIMAGTRYKHKEQVSFELDNHKIAHEAYKLFKHEIDKGWTDDKLTKENVIKFAKNKWEVGIWAGGKTVYLGRYDDLEEAKEVYRKKSLELFGKIYE